MTIATALSLSLGLSLEVSYSHRSQAPSLALTVAGVSQFHYCWSHNVRLFLWVSQAPSQFLSISQFLSRILSILVSVS